MSHQFNYIDSIHISDILDCRNVRVKVDEGRSNNNNNKITLVYYEAIPRADCYRHIIMPAE